MAKVWINVFFSVGILLAPGAGLTQKPAETIQFVRMNALPQNSSNKLASDGTVHRFASPQLRVYRTSDPSPKATLFFFPDGGFQRLDIAGAEKEARFFTAKGCDVVVLDYTINAGKHSHDLAIEDGLKGFRLLKQKAIQPDLASPKLVMLGTGTGGHLAAEVVRRLGGQEQPADLILTDPVLMDETLPGTVLPAVRPPVHPAARLLLTLQDSDSANIRGAIIYAKTWQGYDGEMKILRIAAKVSSGEHDRQQAEFDFFMTPGKENASGDAPAEVAVAGYARDRHQQKLDSLKMHQYDLLMIGNSITNNFDKPEYQPIWQQFFGSRNAINLGYSGYRTENILWNLDSGELAAQHPKVAVIEIGTNDVDEKNYPVRHTVGQLATGIAAIVNRIRDRLPETKIIVLRCFPGSYDGALPTSHRAILERASDIVSKMADNKHVFFCDVNHLFLNLDGSLNHGLLPDYLHPNPAGAKAWAQAMEPLLSKLMGDSSKDDDIPANTAIVPVSKLEEDGYNWWDRHADVLRIKDSLDPEVVLIGNSITHFWGGLPLLRDLQGKPRQANGPVSYAATFGRYRVLNLGFGWDRTQNVLWRLDNGELDGLHPRTVVIDIGTNNTSQTTQARMNSASEIVAGIDAVCRRVRSKVPGTHLVVMALFPREKDPQSPRRLLIAEINRLLKIYTEKNALTFVDPGPDMLEPDGNFKSGMMLDFTHPGEKGYEVWGAHIRDILAEP